MTWMPHLTSDAAACCWIPLFALRCETARRPELASLPVALLSPDDTRRLWQGAPPAPRAGGKPAGTGRPAGGPWPPPQLCGAGPGPYHPPVFPPPAARGRGGPGVRAAGLGGGD